jgi:hypothetical protein
VVYVEPPIDANLYHTLDAAAPETIRYYNARLARFLAEGVEYSFAEARADAELVNRYLDPHGFEYISISEEEEHGKA